MVYGEAATAITDPETPKHGLTDRRRDREGGGKAQIAESTHRESEFIFFLLKRERGEGRRRVPKHDDIDGDRDGFPWFPEDPPCFQQEPVPCGGSERARERERLICKMCKTIMWHVR